ncbi:DUF551 domain-containing protein [Kosakonia cowanii]|uniref:DUF551 domain-containing protein n=1 Tax=Kosakonia cowanii TaxID=208223 RepID=UPI0028A61500|nr:DUF551 domain-containing protein [Kosakonia cowanii]
MKPKMTRGELRVIADTDHVQCGDAATMANMLLNSNPVYQVLGSGGWRDVDADVFEPMKDAGLTVRVLYTAPRDLVAVDEIAEQAGINPAIADADMQGYHDSESRNTTAQALPDEKWVNPDISFADENGFAEGWNESRQHAVNNGKVPPVVKGISAYCRGWNAFREAMLKAGPVAVWIKCSERMPEQKQSNRYIGLNLLLNERTVVQGGFDDGSFWLDGVRIDNVTRWMPLPAAPEQEV